MEEKTYLPFELEKARGGATVEVLTSIGWEEQLADKSYINEYNEIVICGGVFDDDFIDEDGNPCGDFACIPVDKINKFLRIIEK